MHCINIHPFSTHSEIWVRYELYCQYCQNPKQLHCVLASVMSVHVLLSRIVNCIKPVYIAAV